MVLETALNGRANVLATFNVKDFGAASNFGLPVLTPRDCLKILRSN